MRAWVRCAPTFPSQKPHGGLRPSSPQGELYQDLVFAVPRSLSENSICALKLGTMDKVYGQKTLAIPPILSMQMLFSDRLLASCSRNYVLGQFVRRSCWPPLESVPTLLDGPLAS